MRNAYPELPVVPYRKTTVPMSLAIEALKRLDVPTEVRRAAYIMFRNESANGQKGVNENYAGLQADGSRWPDSLTKWIAGTVVLPENQTGKQRRFLAFDHVDGCLAFLCDRVQSRGLYIGGMTHLVLRMEIQTPTDLCRAYQKEWVKGSATAEPDAAALSGFLSMFEQAQGFFT